MCNESRQTDKLTPLAHHFIFPSSLDRTKCVFARANGLCYHSRTSDEARPCILYIFFNIFMFLESNSSTLSH